jgi:hypothetical protein
MKESTLNSYLTIGPLSVRNMFEFASYHNFFESVLPGTVEADVALLNLRRADIPSPFEVWERVSVKEIPRTVFAVIAREDSLAEVRYVYQRVPFRAGQTLFAPNW